MNFRGKFHNNDELIKLEIVVIVEDLRASRGHKGHDWMFEIE